MKIKKFLAPTLREASEKMKDEFGDEAIILGTRVVNKQLAHGMVKLFEITSGIEGYNQDQVNKALADKPDKKDEAFICRWTNLIPCFCLKVIFMACSIVGISTTKCRTVMSCYGRMQ